ncbi:hypothetical protein AGMMS49950_10170 [Endomicrobiia bacterium]|nr:hypothetical protein AGMMS49531_06230 [Endomicrobiia bacterium]GHT63661.1 hypothetical protein AGMMS49556_00490 [Endomicrobiia bacterium]GHT72086.1 hypothetical protein AGMMS49950_10170 [Endomicrobiia bacterium]
MSKEKIEYREYCKDDVLSTLGQYPNILSQETVTMSVKAVCRTIGHSDILSQERVTMSAKVVL